MTNLDSLTPEELNARAAELMGIDLSLLICQFHTKYPNDKEDFNSYYFCKCRKPKAPNYCQDMNTAMELVEKLNNLGFSVEIYIGPNKEAEIEINCLDGRFLISDDTLFFGRGETKTAITKVFILAMESTTNKKEK